MTTVTKFLENVALSVGDSVPLSESVFARLRLSMDASFALVQASARWSFLFRDVEVTTPNWEGALDTGFLLPAEMGQVVSVTYDLRTLPYVLPRDFRQTYLQYVSGSEGVPRYWTRMYESTIGLYPLPSVANRPLVRAIGQVVLPTADLEASDELEDIFPYWFLELVSLKVCEQYASRYITDNLAAVFRGEYNELLSRYATRYSRMRTSTGRMYGSTV